MEKSRKTLGCIDYSSEQGWSLAFKGVVPLVSAGETYLSLNEYEYYVMRKRCRKLCIILSEITNLPSL